MINFLLVIDLPRVVLNITWATLVVVLMIILYRVILQRMKKGLIDNSTFIILHTVEKSPAHGMIQFYFTSEQSTEAILRLYDKAETMELILHKGAVKKGNTIIDFDTTTLPNGLYFYEIKTNDQKTFKLLEVKN